MVGDEGAQLCSEDSPLGRETPRQGPVALSPHCTQRRWKALMLFTWLPGKVGDSWLIFIFQWGDSLEKPN